MCDTLTASLVNANTFGTKSSSNSAAVLSFCNSLSNLDAFNQLCMISVANQGPLCDITQYAGDSDWMFAQMATGNFNTIGQLPLMWQSAPAVSSNTTNDWVDTGVNGVTNNLVNSIRPIYNWVVGQAAPYVVLATLSAGYNAGSQILVGWGDGFLRNAGLPSSASFATRAPYLAVSNNGNVLVVDNYIWTKASQSWNLFDQGYTDWYGSKIAESNGSMFVCFYGKTSSTSGRMAVYQFDMGGVQGYNYAFNTQIGFHPTYSNWMCTSTDGQYMFLTYDSSDYYLQIIRLADGVQVAANILIGGVFGTVFTA